MEYKFGKDKLDLLPTYIIEKVGVNLRRAWPYLTEQLQNLKPGEKATLAFCFRFELTSDVEEGVVILFNAEPPTELIKEELKGDKD